MGTQWSAIATAEPEWLPAAQPSARTASKRSALEMPLLTAEQRAASGAGAVDAPLLLPVVIDDEYDADAGVGLQAASSNCREEGKARRNAVQAAS